MRRYQMGFVDAADEERFSKLTAFERGYLTAMFSSREEDLGDIRFGHLTSDALKTAKADCADFLARFPEDDLGRTRIDLMIDYATKPYKR